ncbi:MAG: hypothetical protein FWD81_06245, partial [Methanomassiliicoccaceae archaeon]|nr:hypothetical protein [Methanomassiliicoccaceae archaeon]
AAGADGDIKSDGRYIELADLVRKAVGTDAMADIANDLIAVSVIGDYSGKGEMYTFGANDINSVRIAYRNVLDALI